MTKKPDLAIRIHSLAHARAALGAASSLNVPVILVSAPQAASYAGAAWFKEITELAGAEYPKVKTTAILDCGAEAGAALGALDHGVRVISFDGPGKTAAKIAEIAKKQKAALCDIPAKVLDLKRMATPEEAARLWLSQHHTS